MILLTDYVSKETLINVLTYSTLIIGIITVINFVLLILYKFYNERRFQKVKRLEKKYLEENFNLNQNLESLKIQIRSSIEAKAFSNVLNSLIENYTGDLLHSIIKIAKRSGIVDFYIKKSYSKNWFTRIESLERLGCLKIYELKSFYLELLEKEKKYYVRLQILLNLSLIADEEILEILTKTLNKMDPLSLKFSEYLFSNIIFSFKNKNKEESFIQFLREIFLDEKITSGIKKSIILACGITQIYQSKDVILNTFNLFNDDLKVSCIRTLGRMSVSEVCILINKVYSSDNWVLRTVAAQYAYLCENAAEILEKAIHDLNFYVRRSAADALFQLGKERGHDILNMIEKSTDKYAIDIISYVLKKVSKNV